MNLGSNPINNAQTPNAIHESELDFVVQGMTYEVWVVEEPVYMAEPVVIKGDLNGDGIFSVFDFANLRMYLLGIKSEFTELQLKTADVDGDEAITVLDFALMRKILLGITAFAQ